MNEGVLRCTNMHYDRKTERQKDRKAVNKTRWRKDKKRNRGNDQKTKRQINRNSMLLGRIGKDE